MKNKLVWTAMLLTGKNSAAEQNIQQMEQNLWQERKNHVEEHVTDNTVNVVPSIDHGKATVVKEIMSPDCTVSNFSLSDLTYTSTRAYAWCRTRQRRASCRQPPYP